MLKQQLRDQKRPLFTAHGTPHLLTRSKPRWLAVRARQSCGSCAKIHLAPFSAHRVSRVVLSLLRRPTSWRGETSDLNSSPFVSGSGSLGVSTPVRTPSCPQRRRSPTKPSAQKKDLDGWVIRRRRRLAQAIFFAEKKRAFRVACTCFFWNTRKAIIIAKCPALVLLLPQPDATQTTRWTAFSRVPELFHVSAGLRFRVWIKAAHQQERPPTPPQTVAGEI